MCRCVRNLAVAVAVAAWCGATPSFAQTIHTVELSGVSFSPPALAIGVGDTVHWVWLDGSHNVVSGVGGTPDGNFSSGAPTMGATYDVIFDQAFLDANPMAGNEYPYYCQVHVGSGMTGTITVEAVVPALSGWGLAVMAALLLTAAAMVLARRRALYNAG
ncbi:MAG: cupredoxin domain-containing protein [Planctomycetota bacterium]|jgi:plastocyanin